MVIKPNVLQGGYFWLFGALVTLALDHYSGKWHPRLRGSLDPKGDGPMKHDMDLIRRILLEISSRKDAKGRSVSMEGVDQPVLQRHVEMLHDAGLINIQGSIYHSKRSGSREPTKILVTDLTMAGDDFLKALANEGVWGKIKSAYSAEQLASLPLDAIKTVAAEFLTVWVKNQISQ